MSDSNSSFYEDISSTSCYGDINPGSGLPMIDDSCIDIGGNVFGDGPNCFE